MESEIRWQNWHRWLHWGRWLSNMGLAVDALFFLAAFVTPVAVCIAMLVEGKAKLNSSFTWHPILMSLAFSCCMVLGRWAYVTDSLGDKVKQRPVHRGLMILAALFAIGGYVAIFLAHLKVHKFYGYDFKHHAWAVPGRVIHDLLGYGILLLTLAQAGMGFLAEWKMLQLSTWKRENQNL